MENQDLKSEKKFKEYFNLANSSRNFSCPVRDVVAHVSDKWSLLVVYALAGDGTLRFNELKSKIGDVSQRMLTVTVRKLEQDGLVKRTIYPEVPPRVEYQLTSLGMELLNKLVPLIDWAQENSNLIISSRKKAAKY
ncbi:winged helix-turn-helix transcriptional regulator [Flavobacterium sp.]